MKNIIITGSSGMIGGLVLKECLENRDVARVTVLVRKSSKVAHPKLREIVHSNFMDLSAVREFLADQDVCFFCLGVYTGAVSKEEFRRITVDYTASFAKALKEASPHVVFCLLSGGGADRSEMSRLMFARDKGAAENFLVSLRFDRLHVFRPGYIFPVQKRQEPNVLYMVFRALWNPLLSWLAPNSGLASEQLAHAMVRVGLLGGASEVLENRDIKALARGH